MTIKKDSGRQAELVAKVPFDFSLLVDNTYMPAVDVPAGAIVTGGSAMVTTAFNSGAGDNLAIGYQDGVQAAVPAGHAANTSVAAAVNVPIVPTGYKFAAGGTVGIRWDGTGAVPTTGAGILVVKYIVDKRASTSQG